jgi:hypothetical protein
MSEQMQVHSSSGNVFADLGLANPDELMLKAELVNKNTDLDTFRQFRDNKLLPNFFGKRLVTFYYIVGPKLATLVKKNSLIQKAIRTKLESLARLMREHGFTTRSSIISLQVAI